MVDDLKNSAHVWGGDKSSPVNEESPPAYSGQTSDTSTSALASTTISTRTAPQPARRAAPRTPYDPLHRLATQSQIPYHKYNIPDGTLSADKISVTVKHSDLHSHPQHLLPYILEQAYLPPKPTLRVIGSHCGDRVDFDITLNLTHLLYVHNHKWRFNSAQVSPMQIGSQATYPRDDSTAPTRIAGGVKQFCQDNSENKSFTLTRTLEGLPTEMLAGQVRNLAASVKYRGMLKIEFTCERSKVIVHKQPSNWFSKMLSLHPEKKFEMVETVWTLDDGSEDESDIGLRAGQEWWQSWASTIRNAMILKHKGNLGVEDWIETRMGRIEAEPRIEWGRDHQAYS